MADAVNSDSPQVKIMREWGRGFVERDLDLLEKHLHKDFRHFTYPQSLGISEETREEWLKHIAGVIGLWTDNQVELYWPGREPPPPLNPSHRRPFIPSRKLRGRSSSTSVSQTLRSTPHLPNVKPVPQATSTIKTLAGVDMIRESIFIGHIVTDEDGSLKIKQMEDFTDSKAHLDFHQAVAEARAKKQ